MRGVARMMCGAVGLVEVNCVLAGCVDGASVGVAPFELGSPFEVSVTGQGRLSVTPRGVCGCAASVVMVCIILVSSRRRMGVGSGWMHRMSSWNTAWVCCCSDMDGSAQCVGYNSNVPEICSDLVSGR